MANTVTLQDVVAQLKKNNVTSEKTSSNLSKLINVLTPKGGDSLEEKLKSSRAKKGGSGWAQNVLDKGVMKGTGISILDSILGIFTGITSGFRGILKTFGNIGTKVLLLARLGGRLFWPLTLIIGSIGALTKSWDTFASGDIWGGLELAITGFFNTVVTIPLDIIREATSKFLRSKGWDKTADALDSVSITKEFNDSISNTFRALEESWKVIADLFVFTEKDMTALGMLDKLTDIVFSPVNLAIGFVRGAFGWSEKDAPPFKLNEWIKLQVDKAVLWVEELWYWTGGKITEGWTNLTNYVSEKWEDVKTWFNEKLTWATDTIGLGWTNLTGFVSEKWTSIKKFFNEKLGFGLETLQDLDIPGMLAGIYDRIKNNFMASMENLAIWFMTMPTKIGLELEKEWILAIAQLKTGFIRFGDWIAGLPDSILLASLQKVKATVPAAVSYAMGIDGFLTKAESRVNSRGSGTAVALERIDYDTAKQLGNLNEKRQDLEKFQQQLLDARTYNNNNTTVNSGGIVIDQELSAQDMFNGGSRFDFIGAQ